MTLAVIIDSGQIFGGLSKIITETWNNHKREHKRRNLKEIIYVTNSVKNIFVLKNYYVILLLCFFYRTHAPEIHTTSSVTTNRCDYSDYSVSDRATDCENGVVAYNEIRSIGYRCLLQNYKVQQINYYYSNGVTCTYFAGLDRSSCHNNEKHKAKWLCNPIL